MPNVGDRAPGFVGTTDAGTVVSSQDFKGKKVVLYFYPKDDTSGCTREACSFRDHYQALAHLGVEVVGVSTDDVDSHARFKGKYSLPFPLISDTSRAIVTAYDVWKEKSLYGKTYMGTERTTFVIDEEGTITHVFPKVKVDGHVEEVLAALGGAPVQLTLTEAIVERPIPSAPPAGSPAAGAVASAPSRGPQRRVAKKPRAVKKAAVPPRRKPSGARKTVSRTQRAKRRR